MAHMLFAALPTSPADGTLSTKGPHFRYLHACVRRVDINSQGKCHVYKHVVFGAGWAVLRDVSAQMIHFIEQDTLPIVTQGWAPATPMGFRGLTLQNSYKHGNWVRVPPFAEVCPELECGHVIGAPGDPLQGNFQGIPLQAENADRCPWDAKGQILHAWGSSCWETGRPHSFGSLKPWRCLPGMAGVVVMTLLALLYT